MIDRRSFLGSCVALLLTPRLLVPQEIAPTVSHGLSPTDIEDFVALILRQFSAAQWKQIAADALLQYGLVKMDRESWDCSGASEITYTIRI